MIAKSWPRKPTEEKLHPNAGATIFQTQPMRTLREHVQLEWDAVLG